MEKKNIFLFIIFNLAIVIFKNSTPKNHCISRKICTYLPWECFTFKIQYAKQKKLLPNNFTKKNASLNLRINGKCFTNCTILCPICGY